MLDSCRSLLGSQQQACECSVLFAFLGTSRYLDGDAMLRFVPCVFFWFFFGRADLLFPGGPDVRIFYFFWLLCWCKHLYYFPRYAQGVFGQWRVGLHARLVQTALSIRRAAMAAVIEAITTNRRYWHAAIFGTPLLFVGGRILCVVVFLGAGILIVMWRCFLCCHAAAVVGFAFCRVQGCVREHCCFGTYALWWLGCDLWSTDKSTLALTRTHWANA